MDKIEILKRLIKNAKRIVLMTGAGFSVASNIPDFRSANGLYNEKDGEIQPEEILSHHFFISHPDLFYQFYFDKMLYPDALPNPGHTFFANLEQTGKDVTIITQNIDGLHQLAGSKKVIELHGSVHRNHCMKCHTFYTMSDLEKYLDNSVPKCPKCGGIIKPDVVLYEEGLDNQAIDDALKAISCADLLIISGTSLLVNPAASLPYYYRGPNIVIVNLSSTPFDKYASLVIKEKSEVVFGSMKISEEK